MSYPIALLPHPGRKLITCDLTGRHLIRHTSISDPNELKDPNTGHVKVEYLCSPREQAADLSTSLLGVFTHENIQIELIGPQKGFFQEYCDPNDAVSAPIEGTDFRLNTERGFIVIPIDDIDGRKVEFKKSDETMTATCQVKHTSARWNFWHYSLRWVAPEEFIHDNPDFLKKKQWVQRMLATARSFVCQFAKTDLPAYNAIESPCYEVVPAQLSVDK